MPTPPPMPLPCSRELFDLPEDVTYLNAAYWTPLARPVRAAGIAGIDRKRKPWEIAPRDYFSGTAELRALAAPLFGAEPGSIAVVPSTSYGFAVAAANLPLSRGANVLLVEDQFPSSYYTWHDAAERAGATTRIVRRPEGDSSWSDAVLEAIDRDTAVVTLPMVHWSDGMWFDLAAIAGRAHEVGAGLVLDLTQSLGVLPFSVAAIDPDFVVAASYKWLLGPYSLGYLYAAPRHHAGRAIEQSWMPREGSEDFANLARYRPETHRDARRFDVGEAANFVLVPMASAALGLFHEWTAEGVLDHVERLGRRLRAGAADLGFHAPDRSRSAPHLVGLGLPERLSDDAARKALVSALAQRRIHVSLRGASLRVSAHVYNDEADVERLLDTLAEI